MSANRRSRRGGAHEEPAAAAAVARATRRSRRGGGAPEQPAAAAAAQLGGERARRAQPPRGRAGPRPEVSTEPEDITKAAPACRAFSAAKHATDARAAACFLLPPLSAGEPKLRALRWAEAVIRRPPRTLAGGLEHSLVIAKGALCAFGDGEMGLLGLQKDGETQVLTPRRVDGGAASRGVGVEGDVVAARCRRRCGVGVSPSALAAFAQGPWTRTYPTISGPAASSPSRVRASCRFQRDGTTRCCSRAQAGCWVSSQLLL